MPAHMRSIRLMQDLDGEASLSSLSRDLAQQFGTSVFAPHADGSTTFVRNRNEVANEAVGR